MGKDSQNPLHTQGFTLIEVLVALAIGGIVMASIYSAYYSQQKSYLAQDQVAAMQQNLRAGMDLMVREIRMAGYDITGMAGAGILDLGWDTVHNRYTSIRFSMDLNDDKDTGDSNEDITYALYTPADGIHKLGRKSSAAATKQPVAENIDALDFVYLDINAAPTALVSAVRSLQITMVARAGIGDPGYSNGTTYKNQLGTGIFMAPGDAFRRRLLSVEVQCRNLAL